MRRFRADRNLFGKANSSLAEINEDLEPASTPLQHFNVGDILAHQRFDAQVALGKTMTGGQIEFTLDEIKKMVNASVPLDDETMMGLRYQAKNAEKEEQKKHFSTLVGLLDKGAPMAALAQAVKPRRRAQRAKPPSSWTNTRRTIPILSTPVKADGPAEKAKGKDLKRERNLDDIRFPVVPESAAFPRDIPAISSTALSSPCWFPWSGPCGTAFGAQFSSIPA